MPPDQPNEPTVIATLKHGAVGVIAAFGGISVSLVSQIETGLRIASLLVGLIVGCVTLYRMLKPKDRQ